MEVVDPDKQVPFVNLSKGPPLSALLTSPLNWGDGVDAGRKVGFRSRPSSSDMRVAPGSGCRHYFQSRWQKCPDHLHQLCLEENRSDYPGLYNLHGVSLVISTQKVNLLFMGLVSYTNLGWNSGFLPAVWLPQFSELYKVGMISVPSL